ncbi:hypothetical protein [Psychroserpens damuponensis]|uniref:hypothetical protein n=1 Tax=Psychroserpens damuponensis TaxID=943936 RepID=UPI000B067226|nr:hypothetical protein [Psychroserpens damuponensis]
MDILNYITGQGGFMILGLIVISVFIYRKYREKRYFKHIEKKINNKNKLTKD